MRPWDCGWRGLGVIVAGLILIDMGIASAQAQVRLQFWHNQSLQSTRHQAAELFAKRVGELTQDRVKIEIFGGGVMGDFAANLEGMKLGTNHFTLEDPGLHMTLDPTKRVGVLQLPYLFDSYDQAWDFMDSKLVRDIFEHYPKVAGSRLVSVWENGIRHVTNSKKPINHPDRKSVV
jgi:TRAP-type C4-dicarboxylate transport system substrate-binding protein